MSKLFTATAVMQAVEAGRLDLDEPITTYLPDFTVHSAFEAHPERRITLRMLLSHTAGFNHEAPVGNSNELDPGPSTSTSTASPTPGSGFRSAPGSPTRTSGSTSPGTSSSGSRADPSRT
jgi:CubicO group peptidase (beta-lactamase class C family)